MAIIQKGSKVYVSAELKIRLLEGGDSGLEYTIPNSLGYVKDYYGDLRQPQQDLYFEPASFIGITTGKTSIVGGVLYYQIELNNLVDKRTKHYIAGGSFLNLGESAGTYEKIPWLGWASSEDITDNESYALEKYNKRTDNASLVDVKTANKSLSSNVSSTGNVNTTGSTGTSIINTLSSSNTIWYLIALALAGIGFWYYKKQDN